MSNKTKYSRPELKNISVQSVGFCISGSIAQLAATPYAYCEGGADAGTCNGGSGEAGGNVCSNGDHNSNKSCGTGNSAGAGSCVNTGNGPL